MKIWIFNNYNMLPEHGALTRAYNFGKYLKRAGQEPVVFVGSHPHNTKLQLIEGKEKYLEYQKCDFPWVLIKTCNYEGSKLKRILSMFQFNFNLGEAIKHYEKPDAIIGSSAHPLAAYAAIKYAKKLHCKGIVEIRDLWPESIVTHKILSKSNPVIKLLYCFEKWLYTKADAIIFTMEGGRDYIVEKGWDKQTHGGSIDIDKVCHINNGVDLELFEYNAAHCICPDEDLDNASLFKVVYTGAVRFVNKIDKLVEVAEVLRERQADNIMILIWGNGDYIEEINKAITARGLTNIKLKGYAQKNDIPGILKRSNLNIYILNDLPLYRFGLSMNKSFEYFASGKPVLASANSGYSIIDKYKCGVCLDSFSPENMADEIIRFSQMPEAKYKEYCDNAVLAANDYDFKRLTEDLINISK